MQLCIATAGKTMFYIVPLFGIMKLFSIWRMGKLFVRTVVWTKFCHGNTVPLHVKESASSVHQHTRPLKYSLCCELCTFSLQNTLSLRDYLTRLFSYVWLICRCHSTMLYAFVILNNVVVIGKYLKGLVIQLNQRIYSLNILNWVKYSLI